MPKFVIERNMPEAGTLTDADWREGARKSNDALHQMKDVQWVESYVTGDKVYCVYIAPNEELIREHGKLSGFPVDRVARVDHVIDPTTAETTQDNRMNRKSQETTLRQ